MTWSWVDGGDLSTWPRPRLEIARRLIHRATGENYPVERIRELPLAEDWGRLILTDEDDRIGGIAWSMSLSPARIRLLAIMVDSALREQGHASEAWERMRRGAVAEGHTEIQLEVREDNARAIAMYERRGLEIQGRIQSHYRIEDGLLMLGPLDA